MQTAECTKEYTRVYNSLQVWNKAKYYRFGVGFQYCNDTARSVVRILKSDGFKRKARGRLF